MKLISRLFIMMVLIVSTARAQEPLSSQMAKTVMTVWKDSFSLDGKTPKWSYDIGVVLKGFEGLWMNTGDVRYYQYIQKQIDYFVKDDGSIKAYRLDEYNIDHINNGKLILLLYRVTGKEKYLKAAKLLREQLRTHPRTTEGGFWHKKIYPNQMWLDGLYMGAPFYAEYAFIAKEEAAFTDIANQFIWMEKHARDPKTGLLYHAWDESRQMKWANPTTGTSSFFWARAMGWYASALVDALDHFPDTHPQRKDLIDILNRLVVAVEKQQDKATGLWYDIMNYSGPGKEKNYFEASASCQFVYSIAKGVRKGYLPESKLPIALKGYEGIRKQFIKVENGQTNLHGTVKVSGLGGNPYRDGSFEYYMSEPVIVNDAKGVGAFLLASNEIDMVPLLKEGKGRVIMLDNYFNSETRTDAFGNTVRWHYKWWEKDNGGFGMFGHIFNKHGFNTKTLDDGPTDANLKGVSVYLIVDPDIPKENKAPNYVEPKHVDALKRFVTNGGTLILMGNDSGNAEFANFNKLAAAFGMQFNENMRHDVINDNYPQGEIRINEGNLVFHRANSVFIKQLSTINIRKPAESMYSENGEVLMAAARLGKGVVFAVGDPWFYNEYVDGRKIPAMYENYKAAEDLVKWIIGPKLKR
jgi:unsaturated rhamnogalacturonyl hydrolase